MTVSTELSHEEYTGNGVTTDFDFRFRILEAKHLIVSVADTDGTERILTNGTDYTLRGVGAYRGGKVILKMPLATGLKIGIARDLPVVQETDLRNQGKFFAEVHEDALDYLTMLVQKILGYLSLCLRKPSFISDHYDAKGNKISNLGKPVKEGDTVDLGTMKEHISAKDKRSLRVVDKDIPALPSTAVRRNKQLGFDNNGMPLLLDPAETGALGYVLVDSFEEGAVITSRYQALHWLHNGEYYRWDSDLPKSVPAGSVPESTGAGAWVSVGDASLRSELKKELVTEFVRADKLEVTGSEITVGGSSVTFPDKNVNITSENIFIGDVRIGRRPGDIYLSPFPSFELDFGEFEANGAPYGVDSVVGAALKKLSFAYRMAWGIVETNGFINIPNMYDRDGYGLYMRAGQVGDGHQDSIETITGQFSARAFGTDNVVPLMHDMSGSFSSQSTDFAGLSAKPISSTAPNSKNSQMVWFESSASSRGGAETRVRTRAMTPVIFLGISNDVSKKNLVINESFDVPIFTAAQNAQYQSGNLLQTCLIRYGAVYVLHPYYEGSNEVGVVIGTHGIGSSKVTLINKTTKMRHQGLGVIGLNGERYYISSANDTSESNKSTHIAYFKESSVNKISYLKVFDEAGSAMTSPYVTEDGEHMAVIQYNASETMINIRVVNLPDLMFCGRMSVVSEFSIKHPYTKGINALQSVATDKENIFVLLGGTRATDSIILWRYSYEGKLLATYEVNAGKNLAASNHDGDIEPEGLFFLNGELYYMSVLGPTGKRYNPVYKIGELH